MSNKQSSVEWLIDQLEDNAWENVSMNQLHITINMDDYREIKDKAKAMHKADLLITWLQAISEEEPITFEYYYNETFNNKECAFYPTKDTTSATICGACGKEKFEHNL